MRSSLVYTLRFVDVAEMTFTAISPTLGSFQEQKDVGVGQRTQFHSSLSVNEERASEIQYYPYIKVFKGPPNVVSYNSYQVDPIAGILKISLPCTKISIAVFTV